MPTPLSAETAYEQAAARCARAEHCRADFRDKFIARGLAPAEADAVLDRLEDERFIDEVRYARAFVTDKLEFAHWGPLKVRMGLAAKRIARATADEALAAVEPKRWSEVLDEILQAKRRSTRASSLFELRQKLARFAASRGFAPGAVFDALDRLGLDEADFD